MSRLRRWIKQRQVWAVDRLATLLRRDRILLVHIPKTAGTSLRRMLQLEYGVRLVYPGDSHLERLPHGWYPTGKDLLRGFDSLPPHNVLVGHVAASLADLLPKPYRSVVFLRDPVQRSLSLLAHWSRVLRVPIPGLVDDHDFMATRVQDFQTRTLGAEGVVDLKDTGTADDHTLTRAMQRLDSLDFVGLTERFEESCRRFDDRFDTRISRFIRRENVLRPEGHELSEIAPLIEPLVVRDRILYDTAAARFTVGGG